MKETLAVGRRKTAVAAIRLRKGKGKVDVNGRKLEEYFPLSIQQQVLKAPLEKLALDGNYDIIIRIKGGGIEAQSIAARLGLARALVKEDADRRQTLKELGFLTRDPRKKERKKYGLRGARRRFQFSKR